MHAMLSSRLSLRPKLLQKLMHAVGEAGLVFGSCLRLCRSKQLSQRLPLPAMGGKETIEGLGHILHSA